MSRFGILSFPGTGHLNPLVALGRELAKRSHSVTIFQVTDFEYLIRNAGLRFDQIGELDFPLGTLRALDERQGRLQGPRAMKCVLERMHQNSKIVLRDAPMAIRSERIEALIVDQAEFAGGSIAEYLGLPFVTSILTLPLNIETSSPFGESLNESEKVVNLRGRPAINNSRVGLLRSRILALINHYRRRWRLQPKSGLNVCQSQLAQIAQVPAGFDYPDRKLPSCFHYTGPFIDVEGRKEISFPWSLLDSSRPLVFVSMGTLQNGIESVFRSVAQACAELPVQTVISLGGGLSPEAFRDLPGNPIVVHYAPQLALLRRAALTIFHGGLNTALESLANGVPMIAIPVTFDQPGVGARLVCSGAGTMIPIGGLTADRLRAEILEILINAKYRTNAKLLQKQACAQNGVSLAADIIERVLERSLSQARSPFGDTMATR